MPPLEYDPYSAEAMNDPYPTYRRLRAQAPVYSLPQYDAYALSRFDDIWQVLQDREHFSIFEGPVFTRDQLLTHHEHAPTNAPSRPLASFSTLDPPVHTQLRKAMFADFTPKACGHLQTYVDSVVSEAIDRVIDRTSFDIVADYAAPVAVETTCTFLGLPVDDAGRLGALVNRSTRREPGVPGRSPDAAVASAELHAYLTEHAAERRERNLDAPAFDIVKRLLAYEPTLSDKEVATQVSTMLVGGAETLPKIIAGGAVQLFHNPRQLALLRSQPHLLPRAFDEISRLEGVLQFVGRTVTKPITIRDRSMKPGQRVLLLLQAANRDETEFDAPDELRVDRVMARHLAFGHGVHFCIGAHAARLVGAALLRAFVMRIPAYSIDFEGALRPSSEFQIGWTRLPLSIAHRS